MQIPVHRVVGDISDTLEKVGCTLSNDQRIALHCCLSIWLDAYADSKYEEIEQQRDELLAALVKHGKHGIHCRPEYMISTGQIVGYKCVDISCPVATAIAKAG